MLHSILILFPPNLDSGMILLANYRAFFKLFCHSPSGEFCQVMEASIMEEITDKCFICSKLGPNLSEISGSRGINFVRIQKVIWDHLLASKEEASFSFA